MIKKTITILAALGLYGALHASSHREAPGITGTPKLDATDFYMFNSYETGREGFVTLVACYLPLQDPFGGPNYFFLDEDAIYEIHIDSNGDGMENLTFQFDFTNSFPGLRLPIGHGANEQMVDIPLHAAGPVTAEDNSALLAEQTYTVKVIHGPRRTGTYSDVTREGTAETVFTKPFDNAGNKTFPDYQAYAEQYVYDIDLPGCSVPGRLFVGQRKDPFAIALGETFDLVNFNPLGPADGRQNDLAKKNVTALILEIPTEFLTSGHEPVIGAWTTASKSDGNGDFEQISRLGQPLVNELVVGVADKDAFNASEPKDDGQFATYVTHPTLPALLEILFGVTAPTAIPRQDLVQVFLTGVPNLNQPDGVTGSEMLRLNTNVDHEEGIPAKPAAEQHTLGVVGGDNAGFPNGRRPGDDVVDIALRVVMGVLLPEEAAPDGQLAYTDGVALSAMDFPSIFPYLVTPIPGSPNDPVIEVTLLGSPDLMSFMALSSGVTYDTETREITAPKLASDRGFYKLRSDSEDVSLSIASVGEENVVLKVLVK